MKTRELAIGGFANLEGFHPGGEGGGIDAEQFGGALVAGHKKDVVLTARLDALSPLSTLSRGYAVARDPEGNTLSSVEDFEVGDPFTLVLRDGQIDGRAENVARSLEHPEPL